MNDTERQRDTAPPPNTDTPAHVEARVSASELEAASAVVRYYADQLLAAPARNAEPPSGD